MTQDQIDRINSLCPEDQGIFKEPWGIDTKEKRAVVYMRWCTGGMEGGGYHESSYLHPYTGNSRPAFFALQAVLKELGVDPIMENSAIVKNLTQEVNYLTDNEDYYGNYDNYDVEYIVLEDLEQAIWHILNSKI